MRNRPRSFFLFLVKNYVNIRLKCIRSEAGIVVTAVNLNPGATPILRGPLPPVYRLHPAQQWGPSAWFHLGPKDRLWSRRGPPNGPRVIGVQNRPMEISDYSARYRRGFSGINRVGGSAGGAGDRVQPVEATGWGQSRPSESVHRVGKNHRTLGDKSDDNC